MRDAALASGVAAALVERNIPFMVVGAAALAVRGLSRGTADIDFMTTETSVLRLDWTGLPAGTSVESRRGESDDPLAGTVVFNLAGCTPIDLVVGRWKWQREIIERSELLELGAFKARVPTVPDLVLLKVEAGGLLDQNDALNLIEIHGREVLRVIESRIRDMPERLQNAWREFTQRYDFHP